MHVFATAMRTAVGLLVRRPQPGPCQRGLLLLRLELLSFTQTWASPQFTYISRSLLSGYVLVCRHPSMKALALPPCPPLQSPPALTWLPPLLPPPPPFIPPPLPPHPPSLPPPQLPLLRWPQLSSNRSCFPRPPVLTVAPPSCMIHWHSESIS